MCRQSSAGRIQTRQVGAIPAVAVESECSIRVILGRISRRELSLSGPLQDTQRTDGSSVRTRCLPRHRTLCGGGES